MQRYIRLTELIPQLLDMVDHKQLAFNPAVELSYLKKEEQEQFLEAMDYAQAAPSLSQAQRVKKLSQSGECTLDAMCDIMDEVKKGDLDRITIRNDVNYPAFGAVAEKETEKSGTVERQGTREWCFYLCKKRRKNEREEFYNLCNRRNECIYSRFIG